MIHVKNKRKIFENHAEREMLVFSLSFWNKHGADYSYNMVQSSDSNAVI